MLFDGIRDWKCSNYANIQKLIKGSNRKNIKEVREDKK